MIQEKLNFIKEVMHNYGEESGSQTIYQKLIQPLEHQIESINFWKDIVLTEDGKLNVEQVEKELSDFRFIMEQVPLVYSHITNGNLSKVNYFASAVIGEADRVQQQEIEEAVKEAVELKDAEISTLKEQMRDMLVFTEPPTAVEWAIMRRQMQALCGSDSTQNVPQASAAQFSSGEAIERMVEDGPFVMPNQEGR